MLSNTDFQCAICLDTINIEAISSVTPCFHKFCFSCIQNWTSRKPSCPLCKKPLTSIIKPTLGGLETIKIDENSLNQGKQESEVLEEFECLEVGFFIEEYQSLLSSISALEFDLKSGKYIRENDKLVSAFKLILDVKKDIKDRIQNLRDAVSIIPLTLLKEIKEANSLFLELKKDITGDKIKFFITDDLTTLADVMTVSKPKKYKKSRK